jgi:hypothetical protein
MSTDNSSTDLESEIHNILSFDNARYEEFFFSLTQSEKRLYYNLEKVYRKIQLRLNQRKEEGYVRKSSRKSSINNLLLFLVMHKPTSIQEFFKMQTNED